MLIKTCILIYVFINIEFFYINNDILLNLIICVKIIKILLLEAI